MYARVNRFRRTPKSRQPRAARSLRAARVARQKVRHRNADRRQRRKRQIRAAPVHFAKHRDAAQQQSGSRQRHGVGGVERRHVQPHSHAAPLGREGAGDYPQSGHIDSDQPDTPRRTAARIRPARCAPPTETARWRRRIRTPTRRTPSARAAWPSAAARAAPKRRTRRGIPKRPARRSVLPIPHSDWINGSAGDVARERRERDHQHRAHGEKPEESGAWNCGLEARN